MTKKQYLFKKFVTTINKQRNLKNLHFCITFIKKNLLKILVLILVFSSLCFNCNAQNIELKLSGINESENKTLDSLNYTKNHLNIKSIQDEITSTSEKLSKQGYLENQILEKTKLNDSSYFGKFSLGKKTKFIHIYIGKTKLLNPTNTNQVKNTNSKQVQVENDINIIKKAIKWEAENDTIKIPFTEVELFLSKSIQKLEQQGYAFAKLQLINSKINNDTLYSELQINLNTPRKLNSIVIKYANPDKKNSFPEGHLAQLDRKYRNRTFNKNSITAIYEDFEKFRFVNQVKYPEILFTKDTTKVFVYLKERKSNTFDGFIGFTNNENNKIRFNGYLDVTLENTLKVGEQFSLYWKSDGNNQKTFNTSIEIPYLFKSPMSLKAKLGIFKQDSIFQNTKTEINLGYYVDYNTRIFIGYQSTESSDIQNANNTTISEYKNSFLSSNLEYLKFDTQNSNFPIKSQLSINFGIGKRTTSELAVSSGAIKQFYVDLQAMHNLYLNPKNCININYHNYFLKSDTYIINELFRFGGIRSIRGFAENIFQANFMTSLQTEYRYIISPNLYFHSILDYCYFQDKSVTQKENLTGIGLGVGLNTKTGVLKFAFANGINKNEAVKLNSSIIHINYNIYF